MSAGSASMCDDIITVVPRSTASAISRVLISSRAGGSGSDIGSPSSSRSGRLPKARANAPGSRTRSRQRLGVAAATPGRGSTTAPVPARCGNRRRSVSTYGLTQPIEPTGKLLPVEVAVNPKVTLPPGGTVPL
ncbi:hypothetical protein QFZ58_002376 [Streptomyces sp. B1I3]|nr:hypothetical protein [Streptomyces sp. B1I3]